MKDFRASAEHCLQQWCDPDRQIDGKRPRYSETDNSFVEQFTRDFTCTELHRFCVCYAVHRTIPGKDPTHKKYQPFVDMLKRHRQTPVTREDAVRFIGERVDELVQHYGKGRPLSAVTKAFWMVKQHPMIIFDNNVSRGLGRLGLPTGDYTRYVNSWLELSRRPKECKELLEALMWLPESPPARSLENRGIATTGQVRKWAEEPWFHDRVIDMYLWFAGA